MVMNQDMNRGQGDQTSREGIRDNPQRNNPVSEKDREMDKNVKKGSDGGSCGC